MVCGKQYTQASIQKTLTHLFMNATSHALMMPHRVNCPYDYSVYVLRLATADVPEKIRTNVVKHAYLPQLYQNIPVHPIAHAQ